MNDEGEDVGISESKGFKFYLNSAVNACVDCIPLWVGFTIAAILMLLIDRVTFDLWFGTCLGCWTMNFVKKIS